MKFKIISLFIIVIAIVVYFFGRSLWVPVAQKVQGKRSTADVIAKYGKQARESLTHYFKKAGVEYPPPEITLLAFKDEHKLELWAKSNKTKSDYFKRNVFIRSYKIQKLSGIAGPKLREGDAQVPEGFYKAIALNPNSSYHLSIKLDYPNLYDLQNARKEGRTTPGSNIFIHGKAVSIGCLAMGDKTIEELFVLIHDVSTKYTSVIISPFDPRKKTLKCEAGQPRWICNLYRHIDNRVTTGHTHGTDL